MSLAGVALDSMIGRDLMAETSAGPHGPDPAGRPHFPARAKSVIWLMMRGGTSHHEGFDPKPALNRYAGKTLAETPFLDSVVESPYYRNVREQVLNNIIKTEQARVLPRKSAKGPTVKSAGVASTPETTACTVSG